MVAEELDKVEWEDSVFTLITSLPREGGVIIDRNEKRNYKMYTLSEHMLHLLPRRPDGGTGWSAPSSTGNS